MKIAYLHGLESSIKPNDPKIQFLNKEFSKVYTPSINYRDDATFKKLLNDIKELQPDLIVGSSMGGYVSYLIGCKLSIPTLLFNPAMVGRSFEPVVDFDALKSTKHHVYFGKSDKVINGKNVRQYFDNEGIGVFEYNLYRGEHRVPSDVFIDAIGKTLNMSGIYKKNTNEMKKVKLFEEFIDESTETVYHENDFLGMQARVANMTREEWIAHYGTPEA